jgi:hypothetical protein
MLALPKRKPTPSRRLTRKAKPGPEPFVPTSRQRHQVELAVAAGMALESIADALQISRRSLCRAFARELAIGRSKKLLENIIRLDAAAEAGNTAAIKAMIALIDRDEKPEAIEADHWATVASQIEADLDECEQNPNSPKKPEFWKNN